MWLTHNLTPSTISLQRTIVSMLIVLAIDCMRTSDSQKESAKKMYRDIAAEFQKIKNRAKGKVKRNSNLKEEQRFQKGFQQKDQK